LSEKSLWADGELSYFETILRIAGRRRSGEYGEIFAKGGLFKFVARRRVLSSSSSIKRL
jgi:hypothetical protein